jgi:5-methylcytosine-specific restriction protein B
MTDVPAFQTTMNPLLEVLRESPSPLPIDELDRRVIARMAIPEETLRIPHQADNPDRSEVAYRIAWARTWLKKAGLVTNPERGQWTVTDRGRSAGTVDVSEILAEVSRRYRESLAAGGGAETSAAGSVEAEADEMEASLDEASAARVGRVLEARLREAYDQLGSEGVLPTREQVAAMLARFRERFGPEVLAGLDGMPLLTRLHGRGESKDSLVYWLEFKEDAELTTSTFGSIAGGSALKFGIYQSAETGAWMTGSGKSQQRLETDDAIARARAQRDELVAAARFLARAGSPERVHYASLQTDLAALAPTIVDTAWGHKVLAMWFPELIDVFHVEEVRAHHLRRLLKLSHEGRFEDVGMFVGVAKQLGITLLELARVLVHVNGSPYAAWRLGTRISERSIWEDMRAGGFAAIGWDKAGSLADVEPTKAGKEAIRARLEPYYPGDASVRSRKANEVYAFVRGAQERDLVVAMDGASVLGVGRVTSGYEYVEGHDAPHRRRVTWELVGEPWKLPESEGLLTTFVQLKKHPLNRIELEGRLLGKTGVAKSAEAPVPKPTLEETAPPSVRKPAPPAPPPPLDKIAARVDAALARKRQVILYGPPGTGKTHWATVAAREIVARAWFQREHAALGESERADLDQRRAIELVSFHPAYGYEDFLEGYRPAEGGTFERRPGVMKRLCERAAADGRRPYVLIIDEINRGDVPRIFGELLTVIERDKRGRAITLPLSGEAFSVPDNVLLIGTMNTADRSIALLDAALRRRFGFVELLPDTSLFRGIKIGRIPLEAWLDALNEKILQHAGRDARNLRVGHAYFLQGASPIREVGRFAEVLRDDVIPLLEEVCYEDFDALERILGGRIVQRAKKRIDADLFEPERYDALQDAILQAFPSLVTTKAAADADVAGGADEAEDDDPPLSESSAG